MFFDSSVFPDNTIVVVVAQFSVAAAGFVLRLRSMIHVRLVSGAVDSRLRCRRRVVVRLQSDRRFSLRVQSEALQFSSYSRRLLSALDFVWVLQGARRRCP